MHRPAPAAMLLLAAFPAWADRPLVSDTADVIPAHTCQLETQAARSRASDQPVARSASALFSCAATASTQWALGAGTDTNAGERTGTLLLAGKTTLVMPAAGITGWGVSSTFTGTRNGNQAWVADSGTLLLLATHNIATGWLLHANLGPSYSRLARQSSFQWSLGTETTANPTVAADVFGDDRSRPWVSAGAGYSLTPRFSVNIAAAQQFQNPRLRQASLGAKLIF